MGEAVVLHGTNGARWFGLLFAGFGIFFLFSWMGQGDPGIGLIGPIAFILVGMCVLFYIVTIAKLGPGVLNRPL